jgi:hypothetical protein
MITIDQLVPRLLDLPRLEGDTPRAPGTKEPGHSLTPFIIYNDFQAGHRARQLIASITHELRDQVQVQPTFWHFDLFLDPAGRSQATTEAMAAKLIILTASGNEALPDAVCDWWRACLTAKRGSCTAVIALLGSPDHFDGPESPRLQFLRETTHAAELDFFAPGPHLESAHPTTFEIVHEREATITPTLYGILHHPPDVFPAPVSSTP